MSATAYLQERGFSVAADGGKLVITPASRLTDDLRRWIRGNKRQLFDELAIVPAATVPAANDAVPTEEVNQLLHAINQHLGIEPGLIDALSDGELESLAGESAASLTAYLQALQDTAH